MWTEVDEQEFERNGSVTDKRWFQYVCYEDAKHRGPFPQDDGSENVDVGHDGMRLADFLAHRSASSARLSAALCFAGS